MALVRRTIEPYVVPPTEKFDGNDGKWSTHYINVGSPGQNFRVLVSTSSGEAWIPVPEGCNSDDPENCGDLRGAEAFNGESSNGFQANESSTWSTLGIYSLDLEARLNYSGNGLYGYDSLRLGTFQSQGPTLTQELVTGIADKDYFLGHIGLSILNSSFSSSSDPVTPFLVNMKTSQQIPSISYGYTAGAYYRLKRVLGNLVLGGYDSTRFKPSNVTFSISSQGSTLLSVGVQAITAINTLKGTASLTASGHLSVIDSTISHLWLPKDVCDMFETAFGLTYDPTTDLYLVNDTMRSRLKDLNPKITIRLGNSVSDTKNGIDIVLPYAAFDLQASYPFYSNATNYFPIRRAANDTQYTLGRTLLQEAYLVVDYERGNFSVNQAVFNDPLPAANIVTILPPGDEPTTSHSGGGLHRNAIAGIGLGAAAVAALIIFAVVWYIRRKKRQNIRPELDGFHNVISSPLQKDYEYSTLDAQRPQELGAHEIGELASPHPKDNKFPGGGSKGAGNTISPAVLSPVELATPIQDHAVYEMEGDYYAPSREPSTREQQPKEQAELPVSP